MPSRAVGILALVGGGEWRDGCREFDTKLLEAANADEVLVIPSAAAYEHADRVGERAAAYFEALGAKVRSPMVLRRADAEDAKLAASVRKSRFVYIADGSPLHLRSVLKGSALYDAILAAYHAGAVVAASGAGATLVCDPMVDPRGARTPSGWASSPTSPSSPITAPPPTISASARSTCSPRPRRWSGSTSRRR